VFIFLTLLVSSLYDKLKGIDTEEGLLHHIRQAFWTFPFSIIRDSKTLANLLIFDETILFFTRLKLALSWIFFVLTISIIID
jgi:hypothetical protein